MDLPLRITSRPLGAPVISVDGAWGASGLNLSHWPGNTTPRELRHDLSTGSALAFARLPARERERLAAGAVAVVNNHYDTDGICALFAVLRPEAALARSALLLEVAAAGDFFQAPSERAVQIDAIVRGFVDGERSPIAGELAGLSEEERHQAAARHLVDRYDTLLDGDLEPYRALWSDALAALRSGKAELERAARDDIVHLDWTVWTAAPDTADAAAFDPGRHALFGSTTRDRVLALAPRGAGATCRFLLSTLSWFDLASGARLARPDLAALARRLGELEPASGDRAWRAQPFDSPAPELWFGTETVERFAEHNPALRASALAPATIRHEIANALRGALALSHV